MTTKNLLRPSALVLASILVSAGLAGCDQKKDASAPAAPVNALALPLTTAPATAIVPAPAATALPSAPRARVVQVANQSDNYAYVDRAYDMSSAIGQAPPDYGFDYEGVHPWVWRGSNREVRLIEPVEGGYRYYYYQPGATEPYLVRDPHYSYGFSDGQLVTVYDNDGRLLPPEYIDQRADDAGRYLARATALYEASLQNERRSVNAANWAEQRAELDAARSKWEVEQSQQDAWRAYHAQHEAEEQAYWHGERDQREQSARSFNDWSRRGYNGPPPPPVSYARRDNGNNQANLGQNGSFGGDRGDPPGGGQTVQSSAGIDHQGDGAQQQQRAIEQARAQQAQADAARQAQEQAQQQALAQARLQQSRADAAHQAQANAEVRAQEDAIALARQQQAQADAARQTKAAADASAQANAARLAQANADAVRQSQAKSAADAAAQAQQQRAQTDAVHQAQAKAAANTAAQAQQQRTQAEAARAQQQAQANATRQAQAKADAARQLQAKDAADAAAQVQQQRVQAEAARAQQQAQADAALQAQAKADAARQLQVKAAEDAAARAQQQRVQADAARAKQQAEPTAARQAQAKADAVTQSQAKAAAAQADAARQVQVRPARVAPAASQVIPPVPAAVQPTKSKDEARGDTAKKVLNDARHRGDASAKPPAQQ